MKDASPFVFAGLWDGWQNPDAKEWLRSCVIVTGEPNELVGQIHNRMPVILPPETHEQWLSGQIGKEILRPVSCPRNGCKTVSVRLTPSGAGPVLDQVDGGNSKTLGRWPKKMMPVHTWRQMF
jgi:putative SOS response-associated peptidase YedK